MKKEHLKAFKALLTDVFFGCYTVFISKKVILDLMILGQRRLEYQMKESMWLLAVGVAIGLLMFFLNKPSIGRAIQGIRTQTDAKGTKNILIWVIVFILLVTFVAGFRISQVSMTEFLSQKGFQGVIRIFGQMLNPNFAILEMTLQAALETIFMALMATLFSLPFAFILSFFAARNLMIQHPVLRAVYYSARFVLNLTRSIEPLIWAIVFSVWVGIGPFAGMLALMLHSIASLAKLYSEQIENIDDGPMEAMIATGASPVQVVWFGVVPQITLPFLSFTIYRWDINVRMATVIGLVGGGGLGTLLMQYQGLAKWSEVGLIVIVIAIIVWVMDYASAKIREAIK